MQTEQRREQVVLELHRLFAHRCRHRFRRHQIEKRLLRIQSGRNEAARMNLLPGSQFDARCPAVLHEDAAKFDAAPDFAPMLSDVGNEATREAGSPAHHHLRLGARREQGRDGVAEALQAEIHFAQAVEEEQAGAHGIILELACDEFER